MKNLLDKYDHISFDLDGTLVHTVPEYRHKIVPEVIRNLGGNVTDTRAIDRFWFEAGRDKIVENEFGIEVNKFWELFRKMDSPENRSAHTRAYGDAERTFLKLKKHGKIISILTGAPHFIAEMEIKKLNGAPYDLYLSIHDSKFADKPDAKSFRYALEKLEINANETVYIGNSNEDAYFAKNAGVDFIYLERKEHQFELKDYAVAVINTLDDLFK